MFTDLFYWPSIVNAASRLPKEALIAGAAYLAVVDIHKRHTCAKVKIAEAEARIRNAELEVEALRLKRELQKNGTTIETA